MKIDIWNNNKTFSETDEGSILVVTGNVSNNFETSIEYLNGFAKNYDKILFIDGSSEHTENYPFIKSRDGINNIMNEIADDKLVYLCGTICVIDGIAFIGVNGWWDYKDSKISKRDLDIISLTQSYELRNKIITCDLDDEIEKVIIVTHSVPLNKFFINGKLNKYLTKVKYWIYGNISKECFEEINGVHFVSCSKGNCILD
jgi:hypothetical protein